MTATVTDESVLDAPVWQSLTGGAQTATNHGDGDGARLIRRDANGPTSYLPGMEVRRKIASSTSTRDAASVVTSPTRPGRAPCLERTLVPTTELASAMPSPCSAKSKRRRGLLTIACVRQSFGTPVLGHRGDRQLDPVNERGAVGHRYRRLEDALAASRSSGGYMPAMAARQACSVARSCW